MKIIQIKNIWKLHCPSLCSSSLKQMYYWRKTQVYLLPKQLWEVCIQSGAVWFLLFFQWTLMSVPGYTCIVASWIPQRLHLAPVEPRGWSMCCLWEDNWRRVGMSFQKWCCLLFCQPSSFFRLFFLYPLVFCKMWIHQCGVALSVKLLSLHPT